MESINPKFCYKGNELFDIQFIKYTDSYILDEKNPR